MSDEIWWFSCCPHCGCCGDPDCCPPGHDDTCAFGCNDDEMEH